MKTVLVVSPHPDDETLGCGGTLLKHRAYGDSTYWLIATKMVRDAGYSRARIQCREKEIKEVALRYGFKDILQLQFVTTRLDVTPMAEIIEAVGEAIKKVKPDWLYVPYPHDIHTDHRAVYDAVASAAKWFRGPSIKRIMAYETLSETGFSLEADSGFKPNVYSNIENYLDDKIEIMKLYKGEMAMFPFPRSEEAIKALAALRGTEAGFKAAEAFVLLRERI
ncbi:MAG: PIG-L family deacetylase [Syntrophaceae bacterium]